MRNRVPKLSRTEDVQETGRKESTKDSNVEPKPKIRRYAVLEEEEARDLISSLAFSSGILSVTKEGQFLNIAKKLAEAANRIGEQLDIPPIDLDRYFPSEIY